jgi:alpha-L-rhamnosidase
MWRTISLLLASFAAAVGAQAAERAAGSASFAPSNLRCDYIVNPLGVDSIPPRLSWRLVSSTRGERQTAYRVLVASSPDRLAKNQGDLWDSSRVASDEAAHIPYAGQTLISSQQVFWKVRLWDKDGRPSPWSEPASWTMGVLTPADWKGARWISDPELLRRARGALGFKSQDTTNQAEVKWVQLDFGSLQPIDLVRLHAVRHTVAERLGFPRRFKVEAAVNPDMSGAVMIADQTAQDYRNAWASLIELKPASPVHARYLRITATLLRIFEGKGCPAFSQLEVRSGATNIAVGAKVTVSDSVEQAPWSTAAVVDGLGVPGTNPRANSTLLLRREFTARPGLRRAIAHVSGLGHYEMSVNGTRVGDALLTPGWTAYDRTCLYDTHDITSLLHGGVNAVGLTLGSGMYNVQEGRYLKFVGPFRPLSTIGLIRLEYKDGSSDFVVTDGTWRVAAGPITFSSVYGGEDYDARIEPAGWDRPVFNAAQWRTAAEFAGPGGVLRGVSQASPPFRAHETLKPIAIRELRPGVAVYDLGQNASIMIRLRVRGPAGTKIKVIPAELVASDGSVDRGSCGGGEASWNYTLAGRVEGESWTPKFFYHGSRYLQVERTVAEGDALPVVESLEATVAHSDSPSAGEFECSSDLFNRIRKLIRWAQRSNLAHVITDCPNRERLGWLEQYHLNGPSLRYEFDLTRLYAKTFNDMAEAQQLSGLVPDIAPEYVVFDEGFRDSPEWGSAVILAAWQHLVWTGDDTPLRTHYGVMQRYLAYLASKADGRILSHGLGDWYDLGPNRPGTAQLTPVALTATAIYYEDACALARIAEHLGKADDARRYTDEAEQIKAAFNRKFFDPAKATYATGSQTANAMPLVLDLVPAEHRAAVLDAIVRDVRQRSSGISSGDVGYRYLLRALADGGRADVIYDMNHQSEKPGYGYQLKMGATSLTEAWNADRRSSQNHFMLGQLMEWFYHDLAGIAPDPAGPGFARIIIKPQPVGDITWTKVSYNSVRGLIVSAWKREKEKFTLDVTIPANTTATVYVPTKAAKEVKEGGAPAGRRRDVKLLDYQNGQAVFGISSGRYVFESRYDSGGIVNER